MVSAPLLLCPSLSLKRETSTQEEENFCHVILSLKNVSLKLLPHPTVEKMHGFSFPPLTVGKIRCAVVIFCGKIR